MNDKKHPFPSRRKFLKSSGKVALASTIIPSLNFSIAHAKDKETLKIGLIGCGGRGTGAANQALSADPNVELVAMADIFEDRMATSYQNLLKLHPDKTKVKKKNKFVGFNAYQELIDSGVDVVLLATPPAFRPDHLTYAIKAGKHVFAEKPLAVDAPGVRKVLDAARMAGEKNLSLVSGFCWRYHFPKRETFGRILDGAIGDVTTVYNTYNTGALWSKPRQPDWTDMEFQMRNWLYYNWLSGDHIAEQAVHSIDMMSWAKGDVMPVRAVGTGGRQSRTEDIYGNVFDHFAIVYEYEDGSKGFHFSRQQQGAERSYAVEMMGTKGSALVDCSRRIHEIRSEGDKWRYRGDENDMYQTEHNELFASIRNGEPINDGTWMSHSTMLALMGRMVAYTGQSITFEDALNSNETLGPDIDQYSWDLKWPSPEIAKPGITAFN